jgi:hypothetical protein
MFSSLQDLAVDRLIDLPLPCTNDFLDPGFRALKKREESISQRVLTFRVRFDRAQLIPGAHTCTNQTVPYGTALLGWRCSRHFVPGYDRTVPPGHFATGSIFAFRS